MAKLMMGKGTILEQGYGIVAKSVMTDRELSLQAKGLYAYLCTYADENNQAWPGTDKIAYDLDINIKSVRKYLNELKERGYITVLQERKEDGEFAQNLYNIEFLPTPKKRSTVDSPSPKKRSPVERSSTERSPIKRYTNNTSNKNTNYKNTRSVKHSQEREYDVDKLERQILGRE